jgi:competence protein ComEC
MPHRQPSRTLRALSISLGAQVAVAPLLLAHFGTVPLLSPLTNLVVAPLVGAATTLAILGVVGAGPLLWPAEALAGMVIDLAHTASVWPQVDLTGLVLAAGLGALLWATWQRWPAVAVCVAALGLVVVIAPNRSEIADGEVVVMDVGQGDAILVSGGNHLVLVDGGPEGSVLLEALHRYGVRRIDLVVVTHGDSDHAGGLSALPGRVEVGAIWESTAPHRSASMEMLRSAAMRHGIPVSTPPVGLKLAIGSLELEVLGPTRRFASGNDQSIVLLITGPARTMLLTGDIEVFGQREIERLRVDVFKVPHHGAGTSDPGWLSSVGASEAIISVGENDFGHPVDWVIDLLEEGGASVRRTDLEGDVAVDLTAGS